MPNLGIRCWVWTLAPKKWFYFWIKYVIYSYMIERWILITLTDVVILTDSPPPTLLGPLPV